MRSGATNKEFIIPGTPTRDLADFASRLQYKEVPKAAIEHAKTCILDSMGNILYASTLPWCRILYQVIREEGGPATATCWGQPERVSITQAGLYNGTAGHGFELDDLHYLGGIHGGSVIIPAPLAVAEYVGEGSGKEFLTSVVVGYEVSTRIGMAVMPGLFWRGYHPHGAFGPFAAAVAAGRMLRLDKEQMLHAIGMAGSHSAGLMAAQEGAMVKRLHSGHACQSGILVALLARRGFTGITNALEASYGGFCTTLGGDTVDAAQLTAGLGEKWEILSIGFKPYPTCATFHTVLDGARSLMDDYGFTAEDCERVIAHTSTLCLVHCGFSYQPTGVTAAQMNMSFCLASMLRFGDVFVDQFTEASIRDPETINFMKRIKHVPDEEVDKLGLDGRHAMWLEVFLRNGRHFTRRADRRKGSIENPMTRDEIRQKFRRLAATVLISERIDRLEELILNLEQVDDVRELVALMLVEL